MEKKWARMETESLRNKRRETLGGRGRKESSQLVFSNIRPTEDKTSELRACSQMKRLGGGSKLLWGGGGYHLTKWGGEEGLSV